MVSVFGYPKSGLTAFSASDPLSPVPAAITTGRGLEFETGAGLVAGATGVPVRIITG
jgi:hypothetical protein